MTVTLVRFEYVTLVLGGLAQLWMHADSFARDDDTLELSIHEIDQLTGIEGFAKLLPVDWLEILDEYRVKLPGFQQHNGTEARRKALTAKRVARHRVNVKRQYVSDGNSYALPDQTRPRLNQRRPKEDKTTPIPCEGLNLQAWERWSYAYRTEIKKPLKAVSKPAAQRELAKHGESQDIVVEQSIANGWTGIFALKTVNGSGHKPGIKVRSVAELEAAEAQASAEH